MRILLHIGTDKTGSTAIQQHLSLNRDWLAARAVYLPMPELHRGSGHAALLNGLPAEQVHRLQRELAAAQARGMTTAILSWEGMNFYSRKQIRQLAEVLHGHRLDVLVYLREQADLFQSGLLQQHKSLTARLAVSVARKPKTLREKITLHRYLTVPTRNYFRLLRRWEAALPGAGLDVRIYDPQQLTGGNVVDDFVSRLGLAIDDGFQREPGRHNVSLDVESALLVNRWQKRGLAAQDLRRRVDIAQSLIAAQGPGSKYFLAEHQVRRLRDHFRRSNRKLAQRYMDGADYPFPGEANCWSSGDDAGLEQRLDTREAQVVDIDKTPTLDPLGKGTGDAVGPHLAEGWQRPEPWGVWSKGTESQIHFRVWRRHIALNCEGIRLVIRGRYFGANTSTGVEINGIDFGEHVFDHRHPGLLLPAAALGPFETVDLRLRHAHPGSAEDAGGLQGDRRQIAFGMKRFGYVYVWPEPADGATPAVS